MKTILITGCSSGIGLGLCEKYLKDGHKVYGISRRKVDKLEKYTEFFHLQQDLRLFFETKNALPGFLKSEDKLDLVVLNAGVLNEVKDMKETSLEDLKKTMDINVWANKVILDALFQNVENISQVLTISSGASVSGNRGWNAYSMSKAALNMLTSLYASENEKTHFIAIAPGVIDTQMQDLLYSMPDDDRFQSMLQLKKMKEQGKLMTVEESSALLVKAFEKIRIFKSGSYIDIRTLNFD